MTIQRLFYRLKLLKRFVFASWILASFVILSGVAASLFYFTERHSLQVASVDHLQTLQNMHYIKSMSQIYKTHPEGEAGKSEREIILRQIDSFEPASEIMDGLNFNSMDEETIPFAVLELEAKADEKILESSENMVAVGESVSTITMSLILVSLATFLLGILLPYFATKKLLDLAHQTKRQITHSVSDTVVSWTQTQKQYGEDAFRNPKFWIEVTSIVAENYAPYWESPGSQSVAELAKLIRTEFARMESSKASSDSEDNSKSSEDDSGPQLKIA